MTSDVHRILVVEDEMLTRRTLDTILREAGFLVTATGTIAEAMAEVNHQEFGLVLLDLGLPDGDGLALCRRIRDRYHMPIVILSTKRELEDRVAGLDTGADDYIVKPFEPRELVARVRAQLRRAQELNSNDAEGVIQAGNVVVDPSIQDALISGRPAGLTQKEFQLLHFLAMRAGRAVSRDIIVNELWADEELASDKNVAVYIRRLRQKIERDANQPEILLTVRGFGYRIAS